MKQTFFFERIFKKKNKKAKQKHSQAQVACLLFSLVLTSLSILVTLLYNHMIEPKVNQNVQVGDCGDVGSLCFANMKEIKANVQNNPQTHRGHVKHFLKGPRVCAYIIFGFPTGQTFCISIYVLFSKVCFFIGTSDAGEVIPSLVGNETAILLNFKPQIQHKSQNKMHKHNKCQLIVD